MHAAPPVRMKLAPDAAWRTLVIVCAGAAAANLAAWLAALVDASALAAIAASLLSCALGAMLAWWIVRRGGNGVVNWDGADWSWAPDSMAPATGTLRAMIDLGAWMLLRFEPRDAPRRAQWLAASRRQARAAWPQWRTVLLARRPVADAPDADPPVTADPT